MENNFSKILIILLSLLVFACEQEDTDTSDDIYPSLVESFDLGTFKLVEPILGSIQVIDDDLSGISATCSIINSGSVIETTFMLIYSGQNGQSAMLSVPDNTGYNLVPATYTVDCSISDSTGNEVDVIDVFAFEVSSVHVDCRYFGVSEGCSDTIPYSCPNSSLCSSYPSCSNISCF